MRNPAQTRPGFILPIAALALAALACTAGPKAAHVSTPRPPEVEFTKEDLEEIRAAAIQYYEEKKPEGWDVFVQELQRGAVFLKEDLPQIRQPSIGIWRIEQDHGIALVRWSIHSIALYHGLELAIQDGKWSVTGHFAREELIDPDDLKEIPPE